MTRLIEWLIAVFIFLIPWQARWVIRAGELNGGFWEYGTTALYATDILFGGIVLLSVVQYFRERRRAAISNFQFPISKVFIGYWVLGIGYLVLSIFWSPDRFVASYAALKLLEGIGLYFLLRYFVDDRQKITGAFVASAVVQSVLAIAQFLMQQVFAWPWSGIAPHLPSDLGASVVQFADERWLRAYGSFPHPNLLGAFLVLALFITPFIPLILRGRRGSYLLLTTYYLLLITGIFFTFSRAAWIAAVVGVGIWFFTHGVWRNRLIQQTVVVFITYYLLLTAIFWPLVRTRIMGTENLEQRSTTERVTGYTEAWQLIQRHPLLGVGVGNYTRAVHDELRPADPAWSYQPIHNVFVLILAELGFVGILFFITPFIPLILRGRRGSYLLFVPLVILMTIDHSFWTLHSGILIFWAFLAFSGDFHRHSTPH